MICGVFFLSRVDPAEMYKLSMSKVGSEIGVECVLVSLFLLLGYHSSVPESHQS